MRARRLRRGCDYRCDSSLRRRSAVSSLLTCWMMSRAQPSTTTARRSRTVLARSAGFTSLPLEFLKGCAFASSSIHRMASPRFLSCAPSRSASAKRHAAAARRTSSEASAAAAVAAEPSASGGAASRMSLRSSQSATVGSDSLAQTSRTASRVASLSQRSREPDRSGLEEPSSSPKECWFTTLAYAAVDDLRSMAAVMDPSPIAMRSLAHSRASCVRVDITKSATRPGITSSSYSMYFCCAGRNGFERLDCAALAHMDRPACAASTKPSGASELPGCMSGLPTAYRTAYVIGSAASMEAR
mmetsp:Transcript_30282/g.102132  ORF Transcript_30282/g.102132 Transcript_30282/m.102132 type:complete len:300 (+) Transcript_30282:97-996(+)